MIFSKHDTSIILSLPGKLFDYEQLKVISKKYSDVSINLNYRNTLTLEIHNDKNVSNTIRKIFSEYNNIKTNFLDSEIEFINSTEPLVSCIILLNSNYDWVNELTIPSIIFNSQYTSIEIIVVHNGTKKDFKFDDDVLVIESEKHNIPKAYNKAAGVARGKYLAFFHDDCFLNDELWIEKSVNNLNDEVISVGPEFHTFKDDEDYQMRCGLDKKNIWKENQPGGYLKEVPMVIEKENFIKLKGFPENEIIGQEDIFLHQNILQSGKKNKQIDIDNYHFEGISTLSLFSTKKDLIQRLLNHFIISKKISKKFMRAFTTIMMERRSLCISLYDNNLYDEEISSECDAIKKLGRSGSDVQQFLDGLVNTFIVVDNQDAFEIMNNYVTFEDIINRYLNEL